MSNFLKERCILLAEYVIDTGSTVRACAKHFGISKSTVHKDLTYKLRYYNSNLYNDVKKILDFKVRVKRDIFAHLVIILLCVCVCIEFDPYYIISCAGVLIMCIICRKTIKDIFILIAKKLRIIRSEDK